MATEREFKLIGTFSDGITAKLKKINKDLTDLTKTYEKMGQRMRPVAKEMGNIAAAAERASSAVKMQRNAFDKNISSLRAYRNEMGKTVASSKKLSSIKPPKPIVLETPRLPGAKCAAAWPGAVCWGRVCSWLARRSSARGCPRRHWGGGAATRRERSRQPPCPRA